MRVVQVNEVMLRHQLAGCGPGCGCGAVQGAEAAGARNEQVEGRMCVTQATTGHALSPAG